MLALFFVGREGGVYVRSLKNHVHGPLHSLTSSYIISSYLKAPRLDGGHSDAIFTRLGEGGVCL